VADEAGAFDWALAGRPLRGESVSGDRGLVVSTPERTLLAVIDGLGHGVDAAYAAERAQQILEDNAAEPLEPLLVLCHQGLAETRGAAMAIGIVDHRRGSMEWLSVGNVEAALFRGQHALTRGFESVFHLPGVVGYRLPPIHLPVTSIGRGDVLVMATDGINPNFLDDPGPMVPTERAADRILEEHSRLSDDALVLVARLL
jgi:phosphoserine phosphatase RsbX